MSKILIFAGTIEGRKLAEYLSRQKISVHVCVATEYGEKLLPKGEGISVSSERLDSIKMETLILKQAPSLVIDATHPYAVEVTKNIKESCKNTEKECIRLLRDREKNEADSLVYVDSITAAVEYLKETTGNVLLTTGSKDLSKFTVIENYQNRLFARVLSIPKVAADCAALGFEGKNLICMQGPFSEGINYAMLKEINASYLVTKESGTSGGFQEKINAARRAGAIPIIIGRPKEEQGLTFNQCILELKKRFHYTNKRKVILLGIGMGAYESLTIEGRKVCAQADVIMGAKRMLKTLESFGKPVFASYRAQEIYEFIENHEEYETIVIALSGDSGFFSGAKNIIELLGEYKVQVLPGISSMAYFASKIPISWEDCKIISTHGRNENIIGAVKTHEKVFSLLGGKDAVENLCRELISYGLGDVKLFIGEELSYESEKITEGYPLQLKDAEFKELCSVFIINKGAKNSIITHGLSDEEFIRGKAPMTKEEIRSISISKLGLQRDSIVYDIGAGTGSVAIEMAMQAVDGITYAIEKNPDAISLIEENKKKFGVSNIISIEGIAPEAMKELPAPTHGFIGGSSGNLREIMELLLRKNKNIRIVINAITLETIAEAVNCLKELDVYEEEITQVVVSKSKNIGSYHMMMGLNPIYIISCTGGGKDENS